MSATSPLGNLLVVITLKPFKTLTVVVVVVGTHAEDISILIGVVVGVPAGTVVVVSGMEIVAEVSSSGFGDKLVKRCLRWDKSLPWTLESIPSSVDTNLVTSLAHWLKPARNLPATLVSSWTEKKK